MPEIVDLAARAFIREKFEDVKRYGDRHFFHRFGLVAVLDVWFYKLRRRHGFRYACVTPDKKLFRQSFYVNRFVLCGAGQGSVAAVQGGSWRRPRRRASKRRPVFSMA